MKNFLFCLPVLALVGCHNYTASPVCNEGNAVAPVGLTGTYTVTLQRDDFTTYTQVFDVRDEGDGRISRLNRSTGVLESSEVCSIGGYTITETWSDEATAYSHDRLYVTGMGITSLPVFFDKASLDAAGIKSKVIKMPDGARRVMGDTLANWAETAATRVAQVFDGEPTLGLLVDNSDVSPSELMRHSYAGPVGITLLRK